MIIIYTFVCIFCVILAFSIFIKIKFPFWSAQPVFHVYDLKYYLAPRGIINESIPEKTKYYDSTIDVKKIEGTTAFFLENKVIPFIQSHYLKTSEASFSPKKENILPYFSGHNSPCYLSTWITTSPIIHSSGKATLRNNVSACMTTRPVYLEIYDDKGDVISPKFEINYVDYLCVSSDKRRQGIAPKIIYTHNYVVQCAKHRVPVSLFKREDEVTGIIPLCLYQAVCFGMKSWTTIPDIPANIGSIVKCEYRNYYLVEDFIKKNKSRFNICITPSLGNMMSLIQSENIYVYMLFDTTQQIQSVFFFRNTCMEYDNDGNILSLFASIQADTKLDLFVYTCKVVITKIIKSYGEQCKYKYLSIENISDNIQITSELERRTPKISSGPMAYFFYNFAYYRLRENKVFIIN